MARNPFAQQMAAEERVLKRSLANQLTKCLRDKKVQSKADKETHSSTRTPPRKVIVVFEKALNSQLRPVRRRYSNMHIRCHVEYALDGTSWIATVLADVRFNLQVRGGASHVLRRGESLWSLAEYYYSEGAYWMEIQRENRRALNAFGDCLPCGIGLRVPQLLVACDLSQTRTLSRMSRPTREARASARDLDIPYPEVSYPFSGEKVHSAEQCIDGLTVKTEVKINGSIKGKIKGSMPIGVDLKAYSAKVKNRIGRVTSAFSIDYRGNGSVSISNRILRSNYTLNTKLKSNGSIGVSLSPRPIKVMIDDVEIVALIGFEVSIQVTGLCISPERKPIEVVDVILFAIIGAILIIILRGSRFQMGPIPAGVPMA